MASKGATLQVTPGSPLHKHSKGAAQSKCLQDYQCRIPRTKLCPLGNPQHKAFSTGDNPYKGSKSVRRHFLSQASNTLFSFSNSAVLQMLKTAVWKGMLGMAGVMFPCSSPTAPDQQTQMHQSNPGACSPMQWHSQSELLHITPLNWPTISKPPDTSAFSSGP